MKKHLLILTLLFAFNASAQNWSSVNFPYNMVWSADELNSKLYVAHGGAGIAEYDGTTWNLLNNFNNSSNTPHKSKSAVKKIGSLLYCGAEDFNTSGEGIMHTYDGTNWANKQNADFGYNANYKISSFEEFQGNVYAGGVFAVPGTMLYNISKWNGTEWVSAGKSIQYYGALNNPVHKLQVLHNRLYVLAQNDLYFYNGTAWDSLSLAASYASLTDAAVVGSDLYICGTMNTPNGTVTVSKYNGTTLTTVSNSYFLVRKLFGDGSTLYAVVQKAYQGDVYLVKYDGTTWTDVSFLAAHNTGPVPGYEIADYNAIFKFAGKIHVGGRFTKVNNIAISSLARLDATASAAPAAPTNLVLTPGKVEMPGEITLDWTDNSNNEDGFVIERSTDNISFTKIDSVSSNINTYTNSGLTGGTVYYYKVAAYNSVGTSSYSNTVNGSPLSINEIDQNNLVSVYPNPSNGIFNIRVDKKLSDAIIRIYNLQGEMIFERNVATINSDYRIDLAELAQGSYLLQVVSEKEGLNCNRRIFKNN